MRLQGKKSRTENRREQKEKNRELVPNPVTLDHSVTSYDVKKRKGIEAQRVKHPTPSQATDALTGEEEQNGKQKRTKRNRKRVPNPATLDHSVVSYDAQVVVQWVGHGRDGLIP